MSLGEKVTYFQISLIPLSVNSFVGFSTCHSHPNPGCARWEYYLHYFVIPTENHPGGAQAGENKIWAGRYGGYRS